MSTRCSSTRKLKSWRASCGNMVYMHAPYTHTHTPARTRVQTHSLKLPLFLSLILSLSYSTKLEWNISNKKLNIFRKLREGKSIKGHEILTLEGKSVLIIPGQSIKRHALQTLWGEIYPSVLTLALLRLCCVYLSHSRAAVLCVSVIFTRCCVVCICHIHCCTMAMIGRLHTMLSSFYKRALQPQAPFQKRTHVRSKLNIVAGPLEVAKSVLWVLVYRRTEWHNS